MAHLKRIASIIGLKKTIYHTRKINVFEDYVREKIWDNWHQAEIALYPNNLLRYYLHLQMKYL